MKISSAAGMPALSGTPPAADQEVLKGQEFDAQLRQVTDALKEKPSADQKKAAANVTNTVQDGVKLRKVCQDMEAVFLNMLMSQMRATIPKDPLLGESNAQNIMQSMLDTEMTKNMAKAGGIGLADMLYRQLSPTHSALKGRNV
ncbi:MAG TPA: rod-binding protein [Patescibacteria group bacterium]|nr:rod-binding protein [Patescibacteria group bacterium]